jgi:hypothetical protein
MECNSQFIKFHEEIIWFVKLKTEINNGHFCLEMSLGLK